MPMRRTYAIPKADGESDGEWFARVSGLPFVFAGERAVEAVPSQGLVTVIGEVPGAVPVAEEEVA